MKQRLGDRVLASRVELALLTDPATRHHRIGVDACRGIVTLESTTRLERAIELARSVAGVRDVKVRPLPVPIPTLFG